MVCVSWYMVRFFLFSVRVVVCFCGNKIVSVGVEIGVLVKGGVVVF